MMLDIILNILNYELVEQISSNIEQNYCINTYKIADYNKKYFYLKLGVFEIKYLLNCDYEYKLLKFEKEITKSFSELNASVRYVTSFEFETVNELFNGFITEYWDHNLSEFKIPIDEKIYEKLKKQIQIIHENNIAHLNIKPQNIFIKLNENNEIINATIYNFGCAINNYDDNNQSFIIRMIDYHLSNYYLKSEIRQKINYEEIIKNPYKLDFLCLENLII